jgi:hypothetical protein
MNFRLSTDLDIDHVKSILLNNIDRSFLFGEFKICFSGSTSLKIRRRIYNAFTSVFLGRIFKEDSKTVVEGNFRVSKIPFIFHGMMIIVFGILFLYSFLTLISHGNIKNVYNIVLSVAIITFEVFFIIFSKKRGKKDEQFIIEKLQSLLVGNNTHLNKNDE